MAKSRNNALEFSSAGSVLASNGDTTTGSFGAIQCLKDSTIGSVTSSNIDQLTNTDMSGQTFGAGTIIYGQFSSVTITSGFVALHKV